MHCPLSGIGRIVAVFWVWIILVGGETKMYFCTLYTSMLSQYILHSNRRQQGTAPQTKNSPTRRLCRERNELGFSMPSSACVNTALKFSPHIYSRWNGVESAGKDKDGTKDYCKAQHVDDGASLARRWLVIINRSPRPTLFPDRVPPWRSLGTRLIIMVLYGSAAFIAVLCTCSQALIDKDWWDYWPTWFFY